MSTQRSHELTEAISRMIVKQPFFAVVMLDLLTILETDAIPTAATDGKHIFVNPKFFNPLTLNERVFVLCHEVMHVVMDHCGRNKLYLDRGIGPDLKIWSPKRWNFATDYIINDLLKASGVTEMPQGGLYDPHRGNKDDLADDVYSKIKDDDDDSGNWDQHMPAAGDAASPQDIQRAAAGAKAAAKAQGDLPGAIERLVDGLLEPEVNWREQLELTVVNLAGRDESTWARPNRKRLAVAPHIYMPGRNSFRAGVIVGVVDVSGSISDDEVRCFLTELAGIADQVKPEAFFLSSVDVQPNDLTLCESSDEVADYQTKGGGGTNMESIYPYLDQQDVMPDTVVILTDGYTSFNESPPYPVIWVMTTDQEAPYGKNIRIRIDQ